MSQKSRAQARAIFDAAVDAVMPANAMRSANLDALLADTAAAKNILVVGGGKAGAGMVRALEHLLADQIDRVCGIVNVPDNQVGPTQRVRLNCARPFSRNEPTAAGVEGAETMLRLVGDSNSETVVIVLLSGGGSALLPAPVQDITLAEKTEITRSLSLSGATIQELNCVRKHISKIKGGRLAEAARNAGAAWSLIISDVAGDLLDVIASGPTAPDPSTFADAFAVLTKYGLEKTSESIATYLRRGFNGQLSETPKSLTPNIQNLIIANNAMALSAAERKATSFGFNVQVWPTPVVGNVRDAARPISQQIRQSSLQRTCLIFGGETTVSLGTSTGRGGRNQELALFLAKELSGRLEHMTVLCCGTDGEDGPTDAAGACIDQEILFRTTLQNVAHSLEKHDSYPLLTQIGGLIRTGLTGTNVMDLGIVIVDHISGCQTN